MEVVNQVVSTLKQGFSMVPNDFSKLVFASDPILFASVLVVTLIVGCFVLSNIMGNYSQVDRLWSILPPALVVFYWYRTTMSDPRITIMAVLVSLWGARLTFNFWRKGGYNMKEEDYRWQPLKATIQPWPLWQMFNLFFICIFQLVLLGLISSPVDMVYRNANKVKLGTIDAVLMFAFVTLLLIETIADQQQWIFQGEKYRRMREGLPLTGDYKLGFLTGGLFQFSRHPNFVCEIAIWWVFYLFGVVANGGQFLNWTLAGPFILTILFQGSTNFTETLSIAKYPDYIRYQRTTSRLIPFIPGHSLHDEADVKSLVVVSATGLANIDPKNTSPSTKKKTTQNKSSNLPTSPKGSRKKDNTTVKKGATAEANTAPSDAPTSPKGASQKKKAPQIAADEETKGVSKPAPKKAIASPKKATNAHGSPKAVRAPKAPSTDASSDGEESITSPSKSTKKKQHSSSRPSYVSSIPTSPKGRARK